MNNPKVLARALITPDGTVLQTFYGHDYKTYTDKNGEVYMIDGGLSQYGRSSVNEVPAKYVVITTDSPFEEIREWFCWGTRGKSGNEPTRYVPLKDLASDHIEAIIQTQTHLTDEVLNVFSKEISFRNKNELESSLSDKSMVSKKSKI